MLIAMDTTGPYCTVGLYDLASDMIVDHASEELGRGHAELLMPMLEKLLSDNQMTWQSITKVGCTVGPGSFTGLRVGIAAARGLAFALSCPIVGVSVFQAIRQEHFIDPLAVVLDAKRGQVWLQCFEHQQLSPMTPPVACLVEDALTYIPESIRHLAGSGASHVSKCRKDFEVISTSTEISAAALLQACASAPVSQKPKPLYLRAPDAKPQPAAFGNA